MLVSTFFENYNLNVKSLDPFAAIRLREKYMELDNA